jgi:NAD(P)-dependent dehydrogenase (short-subunit alcohol dehydrogenase family)
MELMFNKGLLKGKRILVTGGGTGLGEVMAEAYAQLGATVYICGRRAGVLEETAKKISDATGAKVRGLACDIRVAEAVDDMVAQIWADGGALTGLVNNAAGNFISRTKDLSPRGFNAIADIVFRGSFYVTLSCGRRWIEGGNKASVISILTTWIWNGGPFTVPSAMSKAGLNIMTKSLATEWGPHGIRLNAIAPGPFPTKGAWDRLSPQSANREGSRNPIPMGRNGEMPELANLAVFLMADGCDYLTGQTIAIDGAMHLSSGGNFAALSQLGDADWERIRGEVKSANEKDKAKRAV